MGSRTDGRAVAAHVSVVVSTLDRPELLRRCLGSLGAGTRLPCEIVVVDQGAQGPVEDTVADFADLDIRILRQDRRGLSASQNAGVRSTRTRVVAVVDDDCVPDERWVEVIDDAFAGVGAPGLLAGRVLPLPPEGERVVPVSSRTSTDRVEMRWPASPWAVGTGGNFAVLRELFVEVGGNDERLGTGTPGRAGNDMDLFYRLLRTGAVARYEPDLVVRHRRATPEERRERRFGYGFGMGACVGRWTRDGDRRAWTTLFEWLRLRWRELRRHRSRAAALDELRVLAGTIRGLVYGRRLRTPWPREPA